MREQKIETVDGLEYEIWQLDPKTGHRGAWLLGKMFSGPLTKLIGAYNSGSVLDMDFDKVGEALKELSSTVDLDMLDELYEKLFKVTFHKGQPISWEHPNFQGRKLHFEKVMWASVKVNYTDFFDGIIAGLKGPAGTIQDVQTSIGSSGGRS